MADTSIRLIDSRQGDRVKIASFEGAPRIQEKFTQYGMFPGDVVEVRRIAPFDGPLLLAVRGREIALGKSLAARIIVENVPCDLH